MRSAPLEEARAVAADFSGQSLVPPPRTAEDVLALLDGPDPEGLEHAAELRATISEQPPEDGNTRALANFFTRRAWAALQIGLLSQALEDFQKSVTLYRESGTGSRPARRGYASALEGLGRAYAQAGRLGPAIESMEEAHRVTPRNGRRMSFLAKYYANTGDQHTATAYREKLADLIASSPSPRRRDMMALLEVDVRLSNMKGDYRAAEKIWRELIELRSGGNPTRYYRAYLGLSKALLHQGRKVEAEIAAREGLYGIVRSVGRNSGQVPRAAISLGHVFRAQGRSKDAELLMRRALEIFGEVGVPNDALPVGRARAVLAEAIMAQGNRWWEAAAQFDMTRESMGADNVMYKRILSTNPMIPLAMLKAGRVEYAAGEADRVYRERALRFGQGHRQTAMAQAILAMTQTATGRKDEALKNFRASVPLLFQRSTQTSAAGGNSRGWRKKLILESYLSLLSSLGNDNSVSAAEAFQVANWARGQSVQQAVSASAARMAMGNPEMAELARHEQDALLQIAAINEQLTDLLEVAEEERYPGVEDVMRARLEELRSAHAVLMEEIQSRFPDYAELINPKAPTLSETRRVLRPGETLISIYLAPRQSYVWVVPYKGAMRFHRVRRDRGDIAGGVGILRGALEPRTAMLSDIPAFDPNVASDLYQTLFAPVLDDILDDTRHLIVVPHGPLAQLPMSVLVTEPVDLVSEYRPLFARYRQIPWLIRRTAVSTVPSISSLIALRRARGARGARKPFAGFGDPYFSRAQLAAAQTDGKSANTENASLQVASLDLPMQLRAAPATHALASANLSVLPRLKDTNEEIRAIALALGADLERDVFLGERASEDAVYAADLSKYRVVAFATHGLVPGDLDGLLQPALAFAPPEVSGGANDGLLTMEEVMRLKLNADWVVLSACNTAAADGDGAAAVSGLGRAFFYAGSRALLVSNWPVETTSARRLTVDIFQRHAADTSLIRAEALQQAMTGMIDKMVSEGNDGRVMFSYAHPIFWAAFTIVGDGG